MTVSLAAHLAGSGVTADCVSPGVVLTPSLRQMFLDRGDGRSWAELEPEVTAQSPALSTSTGSICAPTVASPATRERRRAGLSGEPVHGPVVVAVGGASAHRCNRAPSFGVLMTTYDDERSRPT